MKDNDVAMLVVWRGKPTVGKLVQLCVAASARILPQTAYENGEKFDKDFGRLIAKTDAPQFLHSYINKWDLKTVIPVCGLDIFCDTMQRAIEDGVIYEREQDFVVFEPLPIWEIKHLLGGEDKFNEIIESYNSAGW